MEDTNGLLYIYENQELKITKHFKGHYIQQIPVSYPGLVYINIEYIVWSTVLIHIFSIVRI